MKYFFILLCLIFVKIALAAEFDAPLSPIPSAENCHFYLDLEKERNCFIQKEDASSYLVFYGYKYCGLFHLKADEWDSSLRTWVNQTALCLQKALADQQSQIASCSKLELFAFDSHPGCYAENGFCSLSASERIRIFWVIMGLDLLTHPIKTFKDLMRLLPCSTEIPKNQVAVYDRLKAANLGTSESFLASQVFDQMPESDRLRDQYLDGALKILGQREDLSLSIPAINPITSDTLRKILDLKRQLAFRPKHQ